MAGEEAPEKVVEAPAAATETPATEAAPAVEAEKIDISKPVPRPDKAAFDAKVLTLNEEVAVFHEQISAVDSKIADAKSNGGEQSDELKEARATYKGLRERKDAVMRDRQEISALQKAAKASLDTKMAANKSLRAELKFTSPEDIEKRIAELEKKQSTTSMTLKEEKLILKEIEQLKASKKLVSQLTTTNDSITNERNSTKSISEQLTGKNAELDILKKKMEEQREILDSLNSENSERRAVLPALFKEKDGLRREKQAKVEVIKALRTEFRGLEKQFYDHQRAVFAAKKEAQATEAASRKLDAEARKKELEAEELKRVPYEEEMELCKYLVTFIEKKYGMGAKEETVEVELATGEFEGMILSGKKSKDEDDDSYVSLNAANGRKKGRGKKKGGQKVQEKIVILPEMFEMFGLLGLEAPATVSSIPAAIQSLKDKEAFFKKTERGAVESIREKRKKAESKPERRTESSDEPAKAKPKPKSTKEFDATKGAEELFPSLPPSTAPKKVAPPAAEEPAVAVEETKEAVKVEKDAE